VRALAVDPERLYVYWEVTDEARESARAKLRAADSTAWLSLRVYDTTGRLFDGTNAHSCFDHRVENGSGQWFFEIGKPGSEAFVEIGMKSREGSFVRIARSGRVSFPRRSPAPHREPQWLTVRAVAEAPAVPERVPELPARRPPPSRVVVVEPVRVVEPVSAPTEPSPNRPEQEQGTVELPDERTIERRWEAPVATLFWEEGPFTVPEGVPEPVWETAASEPSTFEVDGRTHVVFGPWQVVVRGIGALEERHVLSRWMVYRSWLVEGDGEAAERAAVAPMLGSSPVFGASEKRLRGASELRLAGASERLFRAASERRYVAASEKLFRGASGRRLGGRSGQR
jgi:hypothetical protein